MSDELIFKPNKRKAALVLLGSMVFVAIGYWMTSVKPLIGWLCVSFFAPGIPASIVMMTTKSMYLRLDEEGFEIVAPMTRRRRTLWTDVEEFRLGSIRGAKMIQIVYAPGYDKQQLGRAVASTLSGMESAIANSYEAPLDEVLRTLNEWRARFGRAEARPTGNLSATI